MKTRSFIPSVLILALGAGCAKDNPIRPASDMPSPARRAAISSMGTQSRMTEHLESTAPLVLHRVAPQATDPAIDQALDDHYAWLDTTAQSNHKLFLFLPGRGQVPGIFQRVQQEAARLGYHVIGLRYANGVSLSMSCGSDADPNACYENAHLEILDGIDHSPILDVNQTNSIDNRLTKLLQFLSAHYSGEGWERFLLGASTPKWSQIAVSGHSQGGGQAAMIAKLRMVARVVLFSSVTDSIGTQAAPWVETHVTPSERYWGLGHDRDGFFRPIRGSWDLLGIASFGPAVAPETNNPPYGFTHMLVTDVTPVGGFVGTNAHGSPSNDLNTPLGADGTPLLRDAWRYLLTAREDGEDVVEQDEK